jgi:hypothetical protein
MGKRRPQDMLRACGKLAVLMQDGWQVSVGVQAEIVIAREMGLPVEFIEHNAGGEAHGNR